MYSATDWDYLRCSKEIIFLWQLESQLQNRLFLLERQITWELHFTAFFVVPSWAAHHPSSYSSKKQSRKTEQSVKDHFKTQTSSLVQAHQLAPRWAVLKEVELRGWERGCLRTIHGITNTAPIDLSRPHPLYWLFHFSIMRFVCVK